MNSTFNIPSEQIHIRDPFIVADRASMQYYLFGTTDPDPWHGTGIGFQVYRSRDLRLWSKPEYAFRPPEGFWGTENFWAPEVHHYNGSWYLIASFYAEDHHRGVQIFRSGQITGPYLPISQVPATPEDWDCLDGTLYVEEDTPWLIFSHEWIQIHNGAICALPLSKDLSKAVGDPITLFHAKDAPWSVPGVGDAVSAKSDNYVTDGPFLFRENGKLKMLWSSFAAGGYALGIAESRTGKLAGPWTHQTAPVFDFGGHGMLFDAFDQTRYLVLHAPNTSGQERPHLIRWRNNL